MDTSVFCNEVRTFLKRYLQHAHIYLVAVEQAILKKGGDYYHSTMVLTEIRANLLNFFLSEYSVHVIEINNWSWKHAVLPEGYRGRHQKGSKKYFLDHMPQSPYSRYFEADMTDCICIYWYVLSQKCASYISMCNRVETPLVEYTYGIYPDNGSTSNIREMTYNDAYTLDQNIAFYANRLFKPFVLTVPVNKLTLEQIYSKSLLFTNKDMFGKVVKVVASRKCGS